jgi:hypothetical protein
MAFSDPCLDPPARATATPAAINRTGTMPSDNAGTLPHLDYDLQPLTVPTLEHYLQRAADHERFRVR